MCDTISCNLSILHHTFTRSYSSTLPARSSTYAKLYAWHIVSALGSSGLEVSQNTIMNFLYLGSLYHYTVIMLTKRKIYIYLENISYHTIFVQVTNALLLYELHNMTICIIHWNYVRLYIVITVPYNKKFCTPKELLKIYTVYWVIYNALP